MKTKFIRSLMFVALSTTAIASVQASWHNQDDRSHPPIRQVQKRTLDEIYQAPSASGSGLFSTLCSMAYSVGSFLSSSLFGSTSQEDTRDTVPTRAPIHPQVFHADIQSHLGQIQQPRRIVRAPRHQIIDSLKDNDSHAPRYQSQLRHTSFFPPIDPSYDQRSKGAPALLERPVLDYVAHHGDVVNIEGTHYRVKFQMCDQFGTIHDEGELGSTVKAHLLRFKKTKQIGESSYYVAEGRNDAETQFAYQRCYEGFRLKLQLTRIEPQHHHASPIGFAHYSLTPIRTPVSQSQSLSFNPLPLPVVSSFPSSSSRDFPTVSRTSSSTMVQPIQTIEIDDEEDQSTQMQSESRTKKKQRSTEKKIIDLTKPVAPTHQAPVFVFPSGRHQGSLQSADIAFSSEDQRYFDDVVSVRPMQPHSQQRSTMSADIIVLEKPKSPPQESSLLVDIDDPESIQRALNTYSIERRYNQMEPIYMRWFKELDVRSGLKQLTDQQKHSGTHNPLLEHQINQARQRLRELAQRNPIARILKSRGFTDAEIRYAQEQKYLNFYDR
ncbi:hypothetical protein [Candidatus Nucleicultrix amoebiphila]|jgi:hypothetical protein|uniref:Uncharacterized protein n=1 Tax=Candidatus Nucleicultrix amoebiphila FS5 TaxID=1414854 RepID=A0A1W6N5H3_9PROT|nr:hypothetical protein [Candidatus Nucleicultrix amoebiphila]ARN85026.1 hypothetical protein GQ61_06670 [Candidatus Nucleicultrix amoebiphila FS5]